MRNRVISKLRELGAEQHGYFTTQQARTTGASNQALHSLLGSRTIERVSHGVYRVSDQPVTQQGPYLAAALWPGGRGVLSHESALELLELSDVNPSRIHITVPHNWRTHREVPSSYVLHHADLEPREIIRVEGVPVTRAGRAIEDCLAGHLGADLLLQALSDGFLKGHLTRREVEELKSRIPA